jgi:hypothetical protein
MIVKMWVLEFDHPSLTPGFVTSLVCDLDLLLFLLPFLMCQDRGLNKNLAKEWLECEYEKVTWHFMISLTSFTFFPPLYT